MLRPGLAAEPANGRVVIVDRLRVGSMVEVTAFGFELVRRFDGKRTLLDVQRELVHATGGQHVPLDAIIALAAGLDDALMLDVLATVYINEFTNAVNHLAVTEPDYPRVR